MNALRRITFLLFLSIALITSASGQRNYFSLSYGGSIAGDQFAKEDFAGDGGFAQNGFVLEFAAGYIFDYYLGLAGTATFSNYQPNREAYLVEITEFLADDPQAMTISMDNWSFANLMAGPLLTLPVWILNFDLRGVAGLSFLLSPAQEFYFNDGSTQLYERREAETVNFAYMLGTGIRFNVKEHFGFRLSADYFHSRPGFTVSDNGVAETITGRRTYDMNISAININFGIAYRY